MSADEEGARILGSVRQLRGFFTEVARLLLEADSLMGQGGCQPRSGSTATSGMSTSLNFPQFWLSFQVFRFYSLPGSPLVASCISVLLDTPGPKIEMRESLISGLFIEYETGGVVPEGAQLHGISNWHLHVEGRRDDGSVCSIEPRALWPDETKAKQMQSFARSLAAIRDRDTLRQLVIAPLLQLADSYRSAV